MHANAAELVHATRLAVLSTPAKCLWFHLCRKSTNTQGNGPSKAHKLHGVVQNNTKVLPEKETRRSRERGPRIGQSQCMDMVLGLRRWRAARVDRTDLGGGRQQRQPKVRV